MFKLKNTTIAEFKRIYQKEFGVEIDDITANKLGIELLEFFKLIYRPIPKDNKAKLGLTFSKGSFRVRGLTENLDTDIDI